MSALIKSDGNGPSIGTALFQAPQSGDKGEQSVRSSLPIDPVLDENEQLRERVTDLETQVARHSDQLSAARADGEVSGRLAAEEEFIEDSEESFKALKEGLKEAQANFETTLSQAEGLAALIAAEVLDKMFADTEARKQMMIDLISKQVSEIGQSAVVAMEISRQDFPDTGEVARLADDLGIDSQAVSVSQSLDSGACNFTLKLGKVGVGLDCQWSALRSALFEIAELKPVGR